VVTTPRTALHLVVGAVALAAPALHSFTDAMEWYRQGFSTLQLWLNYIAFLPMPWLLLGLYAVHEPRPGIAALIGALLHGVAFTYFAHTTLYAIAEGIPTYEALWERLGPAYTIHGALMVIGGVLFGASVLRAGWLPRFPVLLFLGGLTGNFLLALLPVSAILQTVATLLRNVALMLMGYAVLFPARRDA
jgi:hypothetical protein